MKFVVTIVAPVLPLAAVLSPKEKGQVKVEVKRIWKVLEPLYVISEALFRLTDFLKQLITSPLHWHKEEHQNYNFCITQSRKCETEQPRSAAAWDTKVMWQT